MNEKPQPAQNAGSAIYTPFFLAFIYDILVIWFSNSYVWKCPTPTSLLPLFVASLGKRHLDVGVGSGYYPSKALSLSTSPVEEITLLDLNPTALKASRRRILQAVSTTHDASDALTTINTVVADAAQRLPLPRGSKFDSISLFYLLHCMPGPAKQKTKVFDVLRPHLAEDGVVVGATILPLRERMNWLASWITGTYNRKGVFDNEGDEVEVFESGLRRNFAHVDVWTVGMVMLWRARKARPDLG
ncbi:hypothetical protein QQS21_000419 [Conoideocrella luteorostrata]|uniref:Methyltransferase type 12 domain-containing protein n=1 Tax=Conoideocrella luteorostrata TaxID=1105319 RepID=A0AAJ0G2R0_9HYPO|nr:hypothetical protein QQS21_000419 [Conoideocrella luteorostrata]